MRYLGNLWISGAEVSAWTAAGVSTLAIGTQLVNGLRKSRKERQEIDEALNRAPEVRHQLELGNVGEAVKHLNFIIETQAKHIQSQDRKQAMCDQSIAELKARNEALDEEAEAWERKYEELEHQRKLDQQSHDREIESLRLEMREMRKNFARTLSQLRAEQEPGEMT